MPFDTRLFKDPVKPEYLCSICHEVLENAVVVCKEGHSTCRKCIGNWMDRGGCTCPECREKISEKQAASLVRNRPVINLIRRLAVRCPTAVDNGAAATETNPQCSWEGLCEDLETHASVCQAEVVPCTFAAWGCSVRPTREALTAHVQTSTADHLALGVQRDAARDADLRRLQETVALMESRLRAKASTASVDALQSTVHSLEAQVHDLACSVATLTWRIADFRLQVATGSEWEHTSQQSHKVGAHAFKLTLTLPAVSSDSAGKGGDVGAAGKADERYAEIYLSSDSDKPVDISGSSFHVAAVGGSPDLAWTLEAGHASARTGWGCTQFIPLSERKLRPYLAADGSLTVRVVVRCPQGLRMDV
eukprot:TRINITY_DN35124_c0_g1_i1.p1 TRINITY_DN35124_c0_g1~~TRINITY_DN35124_c0_g1_i1.p1  ORF type:complete len:363 (+),score=33.18 TRINITY_DN35124_c0_g1_i1:94-1182(+)